VHASDDERGYEDIHVGCPQGFGADATSEVFQKIGCEGLRGQVYAASVPVPHDWSA
jgi:hypothetical protein